MSPYYVALLVIPAAYYPNKPLDLQGVLKPVDASLFALPVQRAVLTLQLTACLSAQAAP